MFILNITMWNYAYLLLCFKSLLVTFVQRKCFGLPFIAHHFLQVNYQI